MGNAIHAAATSTDSISKEKKAVIAAFVTLLTGLTIVAVLKYGIGITDGATVVTVFLLPLLIYGVISGRLNEITLPGGWGAKVAKLETVIEKQGAQVKEQQRIINDLVVFSMAFYLFDMLSDFYDREKTGGEYLFHKDPWFESHMRYLRDHGYIEMNFKVSDLKDKEDIGRKVRLTPAGRLLVELRKNYLNNQSIA